MDSSYNICRCCRGGVDEEKDFVLCEVCSPWIILPKLLAKSKPAWQSFLEKSRKDLLREVDRWLSEEEVIMRRLPYDEGWHHLLALVTGSVAPLHRHGRVEAHRDYLEFLKVRDLLAARGSRLFPGVEGGVDSESEIDITFNGHFVSTSGTSLIVDRARVEHGPGRLLFAMMAENRIDSPVLRFLRVLNHIEGVLHREVDEAESARRAMLSTGRFTPVGAAEIPYDSDVAIEAPLPPLCDWNEETFLLGIEVGVSGRKVIQLPADPTLLEQFLSLWDGRASVALSNRIRAISLQIARRIGSASEDARITPLERSFSLLRSSVEANRERVFATRQALFITGMSGVTWRVRPGRGAHGSPYLIQTVIPRGVAMGTPICMYDNSNLPLGDRLNSILLSLLNDEILANQFMQISEALRENRRIQERMITG